MLFNTGKNSPESELNLSVENPSRGRWKSRLDVTFFFGKSIVSHFSELGTVPANTVLIFHQGIRTLPFFFRLRGRSLNALRVHSLKYTSSPNTNCPLRWEHPDVECQSRALKTKDQDDLVTTSSPTVLVSVHFDL